MRPTDIEEFICIPIQKAEKKPMDNEATEILIKLFFLGKSFKADPEMVKNDFLYQVIRKRIDVFFAYKIPDDRLIIFLSYISKGPGRAVMYLWYLQYWCKLNNIWEIDLDLFCDQIFPFGFPTEETMKKIWDKQKVNWKGSDNMVDFKAAGLSLLPAIEDESPF